MANVRMSRINAEIQKCIAEIITNKINNPAIDNMIVSVVRVDTAPDLSDCKVYISILGSESQKKICFDAIVNSAGFIRRELSHMIRLKITPNLNFKYDTSYEKSERINELLEQIKTGDNNE